MPPKIRTTCHKSTEMIDLFTILTAFLVNVINESHYHMETNYTNQLNLTYWNKVMPNGIRSWSTMVQVMACCLMAPSHYLSQYWPTINMIIWHSFQANVYLNTKISIPSYLKFTYLKLQVKSHLPGDNKSICWWFHTPEIKCWGSPNFRSMAQCKISIADALEILQSCTKPSIWAMPEIKQHLERNRQGWVSETRIRGWITPLSPSYRQVSNIRRTKSQHLKDSRTVLRLSLPKPLKPDVKSRMKM